jgi:hypothetical protein
MTDDSAFKKQVRNRMTVTGEKYTEAHRKIIEAREAEAAENVAIQDAVRRSIPRVGCPFVPAVGGVQERLVVGVG